MKKTDITVLLLACEEKELGKTVESLLEQNGMRGRMRVLFADGVCSENTRGQYDRVAARYKADYLPHQDGDIAKCLADGLSLLPSEGGVLICRSGCVYSNGALRAAVRQLAKGADAVSLRPLTRRRTLSRMAKLLNRSYDDYMLNQPAQGMVELDKQPNAAHMAIDAYCWRANLLDKYQPSGGMGDQPLHELLISLLGECGRYYYIEKETCFFNIALENDTATFAYQHNSWWYTPAVEDFFIPLLQKLRENGEAPVYIQYGITHLLLSRFLCNYADKDKGLLADKTDTERFYDAVARALCFIDNSVIIKWASEHRWSGLKDARTVGFHRALLAMLLRRKSKLCGGELGITSRDGRLYAETPGEKPVDIGKAEDEFIDLCVINYDDGQLTLDGSFSLADIVEESDIELWAEFDDVVRCIEPYPVYPLLKCFGHTFAHKYNINLVIPADHCMRCRFWYTLGGEKHYVHMRFSEQFSRLVTNRPKAYWRYDGQLCLCCPDNRRLEIQRLGATERFVREVGFLRSMLSFRSGRRLYMWTAILIRCIYHITKLFFGSTPRWITFDKLYKGGDNGEYFFHYAQTRNDGIRVYYVVNKDTQEYKRLRAQSRYVLKGVSLKTMLTALNCEAIVATHSTVTSYLSFPKVMIPIFRGLFNSKVVCIQHGLTVQQLAQYQSRVFDNTTLYCLASHYEYENLMQPIYGYEKKHLCMTGLARFDGLKNNDKRFILITPTWRRNVVMAGIANRKKTHSDAFKNSEYFRLYNMLINDKRLIDCAREYGYGITYLLHPAMSAQIDDFDKNDYVKLVPATGNMSYEDILTQASLMVTDYSGIQFDFAYMRKPMVYYHPDTLPPQYESGSIDYPTTGFGPICTTHEQLVDMLCDCIKRDCENTSEYIRRADDFFAFSDHNSCERIYDAVYRFTGHGE